MNAKNPLVLVVDGSKDDQQTFQAKLGNAYKIVKAATIAEATKRLDASEHFDLMLINHQLPDGNGLAMLDISLGYWPPIPVIFVIDEGCESIAIEALQNGAADYVVKGSTKALRLNNVIKNALSRSQAEVSAQQRARAMGVLNAILTALNKKMDQERVLDTIVYEVHAYLGTDACTIFMVDGENDQMFLRASTRLPVRDIPWPVPLSKSIAGRVVRQREGEITPDVTQDPDWYALDVADLIPRPVQSMLTVPLISEDKVIGVLQAINKQVGPFLPSDLSLMEAISAIATVAIIRGQQFALAQRNLQEREKRAKEIERIALNVLEQATTLSASVKPPLDEIEEQVKQLIQLASE